MSPVPLLSGQPATITITATNMVTAPCPPGPFPGTVVQDPNPAGLTFESFPGPAGGACGLDANGNANCGNPNTLPSGYSVTFQINATVTGTTAKQCHQLCYGQ